MDREGLKAKQMVKDLPFKEKMNHYWGYYKKHVIIFLISAVIVAWGVVQCASRQEYDFNIAFYTVRFFEDERAAQFADYLEEYVDEINGNETVDVFIHKQNTDITKDILSAEDTVIFSKIMSELSADEYQTYIMDEAYLKWLGGAYEDIVKSVVPLNEIPEVREMLGLYENEKLYLVTTEMFDRSAGDEEKVAEHNNAVKVEQHFKEMLEK